MILFGSTTDPYQTFIGISLIRLRQFHHNFIQFPPINAFNKRITAKTAMSISQEIEIETTKGLMFH